MRIKFFCPHCDMYVPQRSGRTVCLSCGADITTHLLIHDAAVATACSMMEIFDCLLREEEHREAFKMLYRLARAGLQAYVQKSGEKYNGWVSFSPN